MRAKIRELEGKYYGTQVEIFDDMGTSAGFVVIWLNPTTQQGWLASEREIASLENGEEFEYCDIHYETSLSYEVARKIEEAFTR